MLAKRFFFFSLLLIGLLQMMAGTALAQMQSLSCRQVHTSTSAAAVTAKSEPPAATEKKFDLESPGFWDKARIMLDRLSISVLQIVRTMTKSTTSLRQEVKYVVDAMAGMNEIQSMQQYFGSRMSNRDKAPEGYRNITSTLYLKIAKYLSPSGQLKSVKLRFRRYFVQKESDIHRREMIPAKGFENLMWLEIKIQHPWIPFVVTKLRLKCWTRDLPKLTDDSFFLYKDQIRSRLVALNSKNVHEVDQTLTFLSELYSSPTHKKENLFAHTEYERESYSIKVPHATNPDESVEVQITIDQKVNAKRLIDEESFNVYGEDQAVYELKIPLQYAQLTNKDIEQFPGLVRIKQFKESLATNHDPKFPANKGKVSKVDTSVNAPEHGRRFLTEEITTYLHKIGWL